MPNSQFPIPNSQFPIPKRLIMKIFFSLAFALIFTGLLCPLVNAQVAVPYSRKAEVLIHEESPVLVVKREVTPGTITFTRQNGCLLHNPVSTNFLDNGMVLKTPVQLATLGNSVPQWRDEYKQPWKSQLTDMVGGEYKIMILQIGQHPPISIGVEESEQKILDAQTACAVAAYKIFGSNLKLLTPVRNFQPNRLSLPLGQDWEQYFPN
jgi:hypothetical protein